MPAGHKISYPWELRGLGTPRSWITLPNGIIAFRITGLESGGSTTMTIFVNGEMPHTYYKLGKTQDNAFNHWYEFLYDSQTGTGAKILSDRLVVHFVDGQRGDSDLQENGVIVDPGGGATKQLHPVLYLPHLTRTDGGTYGGDLRDVPNLSTYLPISEYFFAFARFSP